MKITKKADLELVLGKKLASHFLQQARKPSMKLLPHSVTFCKTKPSFALNDEGTLHAYAVDLKAGQVIQSAYCGGGRSVENNMKVQLGEGGQAPDGYAMIFVETMWNGRNMSWFMTIVSNDLQQQIA